MSTPNRASGEMVWTEEKKAGTEVSSNPEGCTAETAFGGTGEGISHHVALASDMNQGGRKLSQVRQLPWGRNTV